jgi:CBS domain-containing protein
MGDQHISPLARETKNQFLRHLIGDIQALEYMIESGLIENGIRRIGAEQEFCLIGPNLRPAMTGPEVLSVIDDPHFTSELARWTLEINLDPQVAGPGCLQRMDVQLQQLLAMASCHAKRADCEVLMTGILPTVRPSDLEFHNLTPQPRYRTLANVFKELRGEDFRLSLEGVDELDVKHDSILFEACNTSFQVHFQVDSDEFADRYNWAQVLAGPVLAACVNSPVLLGKELWSETRIGLFRQSVEVRHAGNYMGEKQPRVAFGYDWLRSSAVEIFKNDVTFYKLIVGAELDHENSMDLLARGAIPQLRAMNLHNGTLYKWNRACYGVGNGRPHLRIENRYLPAGPTPRDEMANASFWIGLMQSMPRQCIGDWAKHFYFQEVRSNFLKAARNGLSNELRWFGKTLEADRLILDHLLPMAEAGLGSLGIPAEEYRGYLNVIEQRVRNKQTGSRWIIDSLRSLRSKNSVDEATLMITHQMRASCLEGLPVHQWKIPSQSVLATIPNCYDRVDSIMITNLVTVREDDLVDFAATLMDWNGFHHLPVENAQGEISGFISDRDIGRLRDSGIDQHDALVNSCMTTNLFTVAAQASWEQAERIMLENGLGSLPVVQGKRVVGIITANDIRRLQMKLTLKR